jgi:hypothetical protein
LSANDFILSCVPCAEVDRRNLAHGAGEKSAGNGAGTAKLAVAARVVIHPPEELGP